MTEDEAYQAGLLDAVGDDVLGPRESLEYILQVAEQEYLLTAYRCGWIIGTQLRSDVEFAI
jgi:hypothetical protein